MSAALAALDRRVPLGACDLEQALSRAARSFSPTASRRGLSSIWVTAAAAPTRSRPIDSTALSTILPPPRAGNRLAVGPQIEEQVLGILASARAASSWPRARPRTPTSMEPGWPGRVRLGVWPRPGTVKWPEGMDVYPRHFPPIRSDRDTVVVGCHEVDRGQSRGDRLWDGPAGAEVLAWTFPHGNPPMPRLHRHPGRSAKSDGGGHCRW